MSSTGLAALAAWLAETPNAGAPVEHIRLGGLYHLAMKPWAPLAGASAYLAVSRWWGRRNVRRAGAAGPGAARRSARLKPFVILHSLLLMAYSMWTFADYSSALVQAARAHGLKSTFYDSHGLLWSGKLLEHGFLFYLSKYYEFLDTAIILAKGRPASRLQTFHHAGAVAIMWLGNYTRAPYLTFFVLENSLIHSLMYAYYVLTAVGIRPPGKQHLTRIQIAQFYVCLGAGAIYVLFPGALSGPQRLFAYVFIAYTVELVRLFTDFSRKEYGGAPAAAKKRA
ncbi:hypothetical protein H4R18_001105 [Coemansia javaensis]|uniref:Elongation of fatty acids protein n=1 Tax=Coemansia javaensis TaxID=2761396 RepID=A0A9W8LKS1_9FUNG|nr:hypothetical protein H4R18_001105 [Coemansia javaensis]